MTSGHPGHTGGWKLTHLAAALGGGPRTRVLGMGEGLSLPGEETRFCDSHKDIIWLVQALGVRATEGNVPDIRREWQELDTQKEWPPSPSPRSMASAGFMLTWANCTIMKEFH